MAVLDHVPEGWKVVDGCTNAPAGYRFINNNKSRLDSYNDGWKGAVKFIEEVTKWRK